MKIVQINATCGAGSTGKICVGISKVLVAQNIENYILYSSRSDGYKLGIRCSDDNYIKVQAFKSRLFGNYGFNSKKTTRKMIDALEHLSPDIVHLHNIHGHDCDIEMLFIYFKEHRIKLVWTFHDCWCFTGYCTYFSMVGCNKWQSQCADCVQRRQYSWFFDRSKELFEKKKKLFENLDLTIVTPSWWLADIVRQSFFKEYPIKIIHNGIDLDVFKPVKSSFQQKYNIENRKIILGVSFEWEERKGLDIFVKLAKRLPSDYKIVLVGTDTKIDKRLPEEILSIHRTQNQEELAEIYSAPDVFVNPTREDNYPTVNMEAVSCGTPVITFRTGGSPETLDESCGVVVNYNDIDTLEKEIVRICVDKPYSVEQCVNKAQEFDKNKKFKEYTELYEGIVFAGT